MAANGVEVARAYVTLIPTFKGVPAAVAKELGGDVTGRAGEQAGRSWAARFGRALGGATKFVAGTAATVTGLIAGIALKGGIERALSIEGAQAKLKGLGHDAGSVSAIMSDALAAVKGTAYGMGDAATVAASMVASGIKPGQDLERTLRLVGDAATVGGASMSEMGAIFGKVAAGNKISMAEINQLTDRGIPAQQLLADQLGVTTSAVSKMVSKGQVDFATFQAAIEQGMGGAALASGETFTGALSNVYAALGRLGEAAASPALSALKGVFTDAIPAIDTLTDAVKPLVADLADRLAPKVADLSERFFGWVSALDLSAGGVRALVEPFAGFLGVLNPVWTVLRELWPVVVGLSGALGEVGQVLGGALMEHLPTLAGTFATLAATLGGALVQVLPTVTTMLGRVADVLPALVDAAVPLLVLAGDLLVVLVDLVTPVLSNETALWALVAAFAAFKVVQGVTAAVRTFRAVQLGLTAATYGAQGAMVVAGTSAKVYGVAMKVSTVATKAWSVASKVAAVATRALGVAVRFATGPVGLIITAIGAVVAALVWFFTKTEVGKKIVEVAWSAIKTAISAVSEWFTGTLWPAIKKVIDWLAAAWGTISSAVSTVFEAIWSTISTIWGWIWDNVLSPIINVHLVALRVAWDILSNGIGLAWDLIKYAIDAAWTWIRDHIFNPIKSFLDSVLVPAFNTARDAIGTAWEAVKTGIGTAWGWIRDNVFNPIKSFLDSVLVPAFNAARDAIGTAWSAIKSGIQSGWEWIRDHVFNPVKSFLADTLVPAFETAKDGIGAAWEKIKDLAAAPIRFVIESVYNNGIVKWWNAVADKISSSHKLDKIAVDFAHGSEDHRAQIARPGAWRVWAEPETGGEAYIPLAAAKRSRSTSILANVAQRFGYRLEAYGSGGISGWVSDRWDDVKGAAGTVAAVLADPAKAVRAGIDKIADAAFGSSGLADNALLDMVKQFPGKIADGLIDTVKRLVGLDPETAAGAAGPAGSGALSGMGVAIQTAALKAMDPTARVTSGLRPGAVTAVGTPSYHGRGRAIDIVSPDMGATFDKIRAAYGSRSPELFYTPRGMLLHGRPYNAAAVTKAMHYDHVHWAFGRGGVVGAVYDQGGWMPPGTVGVNLSRRPEAVLSPDQTAALKAGLAGRRLDPQDVDLLAKRIAAASADVAVGLQRGIEGHGLSAVARDRLRGVG